MTKTPNTDALEMKPLQPHDKDLPRHPQWKVTVNEYGFTRETVMTEQEYHVWSVNRWKVTS